MIDLHTHSLLSDGALLPSELARRAEEKGYHVIAITDHVDFSNVERVIPSVIKSAEHINRSMKIRAIAGCEITHISPLEIPVIVQLCRKLGAQIIVMHGETPVEPVAKGTNRKAIESGIDILAHPGLLSEDEASLAVENNVYVEITTRKGHCLGNGRVVQLWYRYGFRLILNTDTHQPDDLIDDEFAKKISLGAGVNPSEVNTILQNSHTLANSILNM
ncbi:MAG: histidinol phosphate phosphatase domain-containing protein [Candidatus Omnitrophica bacterium]|nr:histidinol phosphate phosphatase domain-containing protein [Candidatus Omnitrophota bacterium]